MKWIVNRLIILNVKYTFVSYTGGKENVSLT